MNLHSIEENKLHASLEILKAEIIALRSASALLQAENTALKFSETKLEEKVELLRAENSNLRAQIAEVEQESANHDAAPPPPPPSSSLPPTPHQEHEALEARTVSSSNSLSFQSRVEHLIKAAVKDNLTFLLLNSKDDALTSAEPLFRQALSNCEGELGHDEPATLDSCVNLASLLRDQGKADTLEEAESLFMRALEGYERLYGHGDIKTHSTISDLGEVFRLKGRLDDAISYQRMALNGEITEPTLDPAIVLTWFHRLGLALIDKEDWTEAESSCRQAFEGRVKVLGSLHRCTVESLRALELVEEKLKG